MIFIVTSVLIYFITENFTKYTFVKNLMHYKESCLYKALNAMHMYYINDLFCHCLTFHVQ